MTSRNFAACLAAASLLSPASAAVIDTFTSTMSSEFVQTRVNDNDTVSNISFNTTGGTLNATYSGTNNFEQIVLLRNDYSLTVGQTLYAQLSGFASAGGTTADIGIAVSSTES